MGGFPMTGVLIGSYEAVVDGDDDVVFGLLIGLVGPPAAPVCADALWECVSGFLRDLRRVELFSEPIRWRSPARGGAVRGTRLRLCVRPSANDSPGGELSSETVASSDRHPALDRGGGSDSCPQAASYLPHRPVPAFA